MYLYILCKKNITIEITCIIYLYICHYFGKLASEHHPLLDYDRPKLCSWCTIDNHRLGRAFCVGGLKRSISIGPLLLVDITQNLRI